MIRARKILYQVVMDHLDDDGNVTNELSTQEPITLWAHQLDQLPEQVQAVVKQAEQQNGASADALRENQQ